MNICSKSSHGFVIRVDMSAEVTVVSQSSKEVETYFFYLLPVFGL